jgi:hypothetical protein
MEVWDLEIFILSIWPCSQNKLGGFSNTHPSLCAQVLSEGIIQAVRYWRPRQKMVFRIHGEVYLKELLRKVVVWRVGTGSNINISSDPWILIRLKHIHNF